MSLRTKAPFRDSDRRVQRDVTGAVSPNDLCLPRTGGVSCTGGLLTLQAAPHRLSIRQVVLDPHRDPLGMTEQILYRVCNLGTWRAGWGLSTFYNPTLPKTITQLLELLAL